MRDPRVAKLAHNLIHHSVKLQRGESLLIENYGYEKDLITALVEEAYQVGGMPFVWIKDAATERALLMQMTEQQAHMQADFEARLMQQMNCYLCIRSGENKYEMSDVPSVQHKLHSTLIWKPVHDEIRLKKRWCVLRYPSPGMSQLAGMSTEAFEDYYFNVCCLDYQKMSGAMDALVERMERTDKVHIIGQGTDLRFSIKNLPAIKCDGALNIPDGEVFSAPVRDSVNGTLSYNTPSVYEGFTFENIRFVFENGKIIEATANDTERINHVLDVDEGARYVGEFAIGVNPFITTVMKDTLFDEKVAGSFHFTPGQCYDECNNGNQSANHWDLVCIQTPEYGGGEMWFDDELIRKDGLFVPEYLHCLNPENLK
ncbi:aminopeptidase [Eubacteriales bacterium OttesenSCG-928-N13]|nr:aminopeptidase [Eubacteriales bacterium OttesenSCG-928-N13]